ncbi:MAG: GNAT family N-acetyltransferase, partial [Myxococcales bacterium]|nr:GNAT family N-acetyltransferase [Myxococcales bacterium]
IRNGAEDWGYFASGPGRNGVGMVEWLFTAPQQRRRGFATALVAHAVRDARARGAGAVLIGASAAGDGVPRRMYEALGFRPVCLTHEFTRQVKR